VKKTLAAILLIVVVVLIGLVFFHGCKKTSETPSATQTQQEKLSEVIYKIDTETFVNNLKQLAGAKDGEPNMEMLHRFFNQNGVEMKSPEAFFLDEKSGNLFINATKSDQHEVERIVMAIQENVQPSKIYN
jgi:hypothetical protein